MLDCVVVSDPFLDGYSYILYKLPLLVVDVVALIGYIFDLAVT